MRDLVDAWRTKEHFLQRLTKRTWVEAAEYYLDQHLEPLPCKRRLVTYLAPNPPYVEATMPVVRDSLPGDQVKPSELRDRHS